MLTSSGDHFVLFGLWECLIMGGYQCGPPLILQLWGQSCQALFLTQLTIFFPVKVGALHSYFASLKLKSEIVRALNQWVRLLLFLFLLHFWSQLLVLSHLLVSSELRAFLADHSDKPSALGATGHTTCAGLLLHQKVPHLHIPVDWCSVKWRLVQKVRGINLRLIL